MWSWFTRKSAPAKNVWEEKGGQAVKEGLDALSQARKEPKMEEWVEVQVVEPALAPIPSKPKLNPVGARGSSRRKQQRLSALKRPHGHEASPRRRSKRRSLPGEAASHDDAHFHAADDADDEEAPLAELELEHAHVYGDANLVVSRQKKLRKKPAKLAPEKSPARDVAIEEQLSNMSIEPAAPHDLSQESKKKVKRPPQARRPSRKIRDAQLAAQMHPSKEKSASMAPHSDKPVLLRCEKHSHQHGPMESSEDNLVVAYYGRQAHLEAEQSQPSSWSRGSSDAPQKAKRRVSFSLPVESHAERGMQQGTRASLRHSMRGLDSPVALPPLSVQARADQFLALKFFGRRQWMNQRSKAARFGLFEQNGGHVAPYGCRM